ncbi:dihydropteroate synthase [Nitratireductor sp. CAU 1489]|uniref:Dihydropteroate synthase n=1 Tax=Nitratireductor arenosus TaxID=2682096 RepID=A0A844QHV7_9HYPH|nr:dihydropteroate synthase [Nitratireductor arenosus]MVA97638.1 dihydropteroate synthase [Nitratireductor arenosus]
MNDDVITTEPVLWPLAHRRSLTLGPAAVVMGIVNVTPDSFSDGGLFPTRDAAVEAALKMEAEGAAIVDIGGESTRPGAGAIGADEEQSRVLPVIEAVARRSDVLISVDTHRAETARKAVAAGAHIVNDIWALQRDPDMAAAIVETGAGAVLMHNSRERALAADLVEDQRVFLQRSLAIARAAGLGAARIVLDPGFGFGKETAGINLELVARFGELHALGRPLLAGTSRKRFIGHVTGREPGARGAGTAATSVFLRMKGAALFRVHDVAINVDALKMADAMLAARPQR